MSLQVISFYRFAYLDPGSLVELRDRFTNLGHALELKGTV